jgi:hypothetical protein
MSRLFVCILNQKLDIDFSLLVEEGQPKEHIYGLRIDLKGGHIAILAEHLLQPSAGDLQLSRIADLLGGREGRSKRRLRS